MTLNQDSKKANEKLVYNNLKGDREKQQPKYIVGQLVCTTDTKTGFSKGDSTNYSYELFTLTEVNHDTIPPYRIVYLPGKNNQNLLRPSKLSLEQNTQFIKKRNLFKKINN